MKPKLPFAVFAATTIASVSSAAPVTKDTTGTDLTNGISWVGGAAPVSTDIATWSATSLGGTLTMDSAQSWDGINVSGATANINITTTGAVLTLGGSGITLTGNRTLAIANAIDTGATSQIWNIADVTANPNVDASFSGSITGSGTLTKSGAGRINVDSNLSSYTGKISILGGNLAYGFNGGTVGSNPGAFIADGLTIDGGRLSNTTGGIVNYSIGANRGVTLGAGGGAFDIDSSSGNVGVTINSVVTGSGALTKTQGGFLALNGANTYTGGTIIQRGSALTATNAAINLGNGAAFGTGNVTFTNTASMNGLRFVFTGPAPSQTVANNIALSSTAGITNRWILDSGRTATLTGVISGGNATAVLQKDGAGTLVLANSNTYAGGTTITSGIVRVSNSDTALSTGAVTFNGNATLATQSGGGARNLANAIVIGTGVTASFDGGFATLTLSGNISGDGSFAKASTGNVILTGNNSYTGTTTMTTGTLFVNGTNSGTGAVTVTGGTLGGTGSIAGAVNVTGSLAPGASIESLGMGDLTMNAGSSFVYELNSNTLNGDLAYVTGGLNIDNAATLSLTDLGTTALTSGKLTLISYTGSWNGGTFNGVSDGGTVTIGSNQWLVDYNDTVGGGNFATDQAGATSFVTLTAVPEPSIALLGGLGVLGLLRRRRI